MDIFKNSTQLNFLKPSIQAFAVPEGFDSLTDV